MELSNLTPVFLVKVGFFLGIGIVLAQAFGSIIAGLLMSPFMAKGEEEDNGSV